MASRKTSFYLASLARRLSSPFFRYLPLVNISKCLLLLGFFFVLAVAFSYEVRGIAYAGKTQTNAGIDLPVSAVPLFPFVTSKCNPFLHGNNDNNNEDQVMFSCVLR